jgi:hypothetical protein
MLGGTRAMSGLMAIASATEEDYNALTAAIDGSSETMVRTTDGAVIPMTQALAEGKEIAEEYSGTAAAMAGVMNDTTNVQLKQLTNELQNMAISLGETLLPMIKDVVAQLSEWAKAFQNLDPETQAMIVKIALVVAAMGPLLSVGGRLITGIGMLLELAPQLGAAASFIVANPIALLIAGVLALYAVIATKGDEIQAVLQNIDNYMSSVFAVDWSNIFGPVLGEPINSFMATLQNFYKNYMTLFNGIIDFIRGVFTGDWDRAWRGIKEIFAGYFGQFVSIAKIPLNGVIALINGVISGINRMVDGLNSISFDIPDWVPELGGRSFGFNMSHIGKVPYLANGGILSQGSAVVGEAGPELLTMVGGQAVVQPLTTNNNSYGGATNNFYIQSNDPYAVAEQVSEILDHQTNQIREAWA